MDEAPLIAFQNHVAAALLWSCALPRAVLGTRNTNRAIATTGQALIHEQIEKAIGGFKRRADTLAEQAVNRLLNTNRALTEADYLVLVPTDGPHLCCRTSRVRRQAPCSVEFRWRSEEWVPFTILGTVDGHPGSILGKSWAFLDEGFVPPLFCEATIEGPSVAVVRMGGRAYDAYRATVRRYGSDEAIRAVLDDENLAS